MHAGYVDPLHAARPAWWIISGAEFLAGVAQRELQLQWRLPVGHQVPAVVTHPLRLHTPNPQSPKSPNQKIY
jgi:hypothetical protein